MSGLNKDVLKLDLDMVADEIVDFIRRAVRRSGAAGVVLGLSGGVDSGLVAALCVRALGPEKVMGVIMPTDFTPRKDVDDAKEFAVSLGIRTEFANIQGVSEAFFEELGVDENDARQRLPMANVRARVRMVALYHFANLHNYLVIGTGDRSERLIGYFTKYGDGGADFLPIAHLYKTQVRELAAHLDVPKKIAEKPSSPQLYPGHKALDEIPLCYERLDPVLVGLFDRKMAPSDVSSVTGVPLDVVEEVLRCSNRSRHKRTLPPTLKAE